MKKSYRKLNKLEPSKEVRVLVKFYGEIALLDTIVPFKIGKRINLEDCIVEISEIRQYRDRVTLLSDSILAGNDRDAILIENSILLNKKKALLSKKVNDRLCSNFDFLDRYFIGRQMMFSAKHMLEDINRFAKIEYAIKDSEIEDLHVDCNK